VSILISTSVTYEEGFTAVMVMNLRLPRYRLYKKLKEIKIVKKSYEAKTKKRTIEKKNV
jgi:hypothetical protein